MSTQKPLHLGTELLLCLQLNIGFCHLYWVLALEEKAKGGLGMSVPMFTQVLWSSSCASAEAPKRFKWDGWEKHPGHEPGDRNESWYQEGEASCSVSTLGPHGSPIRGDGGGNPGLMEALMSVLWGWGYWEKWG